MLYKSKMLIDSICIYSMLYAEVHTLIVPYSTMHRLLHHSSRTYNYVIVRERAGRVFDTHIWLWPQPDFDVNQTVGCRALRDKSTSLSSSSPSSALQSYSLGFFHNMAKFLSAFRHSSLPADPQSSEIFLDTVLVFLFACFHPVCPSIPFQIIFLLSVFVAFPSYDYFRFSWNLFRYTSCISLFFLILHTPCIRLWITDPWIFF